MVSEGECGWRTGTCNPQHSIVVSFIRSSRTFLQPSYSVTFVLHARFYGPRVLLRRKYATLGNSETLASDLWRVSRVDYILSV